MAALIAFCPLAQVMGQTPEITSETIASDEKALKSLEEDFIQSFDAISYRGLPEILANRQSTQVTQGAALLVARTQLRNVPRELLQKLTEQVAANSRNPDLKLVTLADLNGTSNESAQSSASAGGLLDFSNNQTVCNEAIARGIPLVLFVDLTHFNSKQATVVSEPMTLLDARASLTLLNAADGVRIKGVDKQVNTRGFDANNLMDKAFDMLSKNLSDEASRWKIPELEIKLIQLEVHARMEGIQFPWVDVAPGNGGIKVREVPVFAEGASVEIDGVLKGQAPCRIDVTKGTHKLRVYREGAKPFEAVIQVSASNRFDALLVPTEETRRKFDEQLAKFERVKTMVLQRQVDMEAASAKNDGIRARNENTRLIGKATADLVQSRADVNRTDADSRAKIAGGETAVLQGKAAILSAQSNYQSEAVKADAALKSAEAAAIRMNAEGDLAMRKAASRNMAELLQLSGEAYRALMRARAEALRSFRESMNETGCRIDLNNEI